MVTFKKIVDSLRLFTEQHEQLNSFGWGNPDNITTRDHLFPMLFAAPIPGTISGSLAELSFDLYFLDLEAQDRTNLLTIMNETLLIGNDILTTFFAHNDGDLFEFDSDVTVSPFEAKFDDNTAGWIFNVKLTIMMPSCEEDVPGLD